MKYDLISEFKREVMKGKVLSGLLALAIISLVSCADNNNTNTNNGKDTTQRLTETRRNSTGTTDRIYDTANKGTDSTSKTGGTPKLP